MLFVWGWYGVVRIGGICNIRYNSISSQAVLLVHGLAGR